LKYKIKLLASLIRRSSNCVVYTGAGISTSSGLADYASSAAGELSAVFKSQQSSRRLSEYEIQPNLGHFCLYELHKMGYVKWWCQQNHDGLPQKAGMPHHAVNEIHGAWFDPSNPVVQMNGNLRSDLFEELLEWEQKCDLCLAIGSSLSGMNADILVESCGRRSFEKFNDIRNSNHNHDEASQFIGGSVIISYQSTRLDNLASLRLYGSINMILEALLRELNIVNISMDPTSVNILSDSIEYCNGRVISEDVYEIFGYDLKNGYRSSNPLDRLILDLREDQQVCIPHGSTQGSVGTVMNRTKLGNYKILFHVPLSQTKKKSSNDQQSQHKDAPQRMKTVPWRTELGKWMILSALNGQAKYLPILPYNQPS
jgi:NAD-dependent SIR2 family protein deacetylase